MMHPLVSASLRSRWIVIVIAGALLALGAWQLPQARVESLPEFGPTVVQVRTEALGLSAVEVEQMITVPMEQDLLNGVAYLKHIHSESVPGLSAIDMYFEPGTDGQTARLVVQERMAEAAALPNVSQPPQMLQPLSSIGRVAMIGLSSKSLTPMEMGVLARWTIRPKLMGVPGVANVAIWGQRERQLQVQVDPDRLGAAGVTLDQIVSTTGNALLVSPLSFLEASTPGTGGFIDTPNQRLGVQHLSPIETPEQLAKVVIEDSGEDRATRLRLGDVTTVVEDSQPLIGDAKLSTGDGFLLVVEKFAGANTPEVTSAVEDALASMGPGLKGLEMDTTVFRPASYIESAIQNLRTSALLGGALMLLALVAFLFSWRRAAVTIVAVSLSIGTAALVLQLFNTSFNALILAGLLLAVLAVVDDATTTTDAIARRLREDPLAGEPTDRSVVREASLRSGRVLGYATVIMALALAPLFFTGGLAGEAFFPPLAMAAFAAFTASFVVSLTVTPALSLMLLRPDRSPADSPGVRRSRAAHARMLAPLVRRTVPTVVVVSLALLAIGAAVLPTQLHKSLLPTLREDSLLIKWDTPPGTSLPEMSRLGERVTTELRTLPGVTNVGAHFGRAVTADQVVGANGGMIWVSVDPAADYDRTINTVQDVVQGYPGLERAVLSYTTERVRQVTNGVVDPVVVRIYGEDLAVLRQKAREISTLLSKVDGVAPAPIANAVDEPTIQIEVDLDKAREVGVKPGDVRRAATTLLSGIHVGNLFDHQKVFDVQVWSPPAVRGNLTDVGNLMIDTNSGQVRLGSLAAVTIASSPNTVSHDGVSRRIDVVADVSGRSLDSALADVRTTIGGVAFPLEYHAEVLGDSAERANNVRLLLILAGVALLAIFLLMQVAFGSWRLSTVLFATLPISLLGGTLVAMFEGGLSLATGAGLLALLAWAVRTGMVLIDRVQQLGLDAGPQDLVTKAAQERVAPVLTTAVVMILALAPVMVFGSSAGLELVQPMAAVILGGLVTTVLTTLFILPALAHTFYRPPVPEPPEQATPELIGAGDHV
jgi:Cu/Ag efflux pump CusA